MKLEEYLCSKGIPAYSLDGDNIRHGLNKVNQKALNLHISMNNMLLSRRRLFSIVMLLWTEVMLVAGIYLTEYVYLKWSR